MLGDLTWVINYNYIEAVETMSYLVFANRIWNTNAINKALYIDGQLTSTRLFQAAGQT